MALLRKDTLQLLIFSPILRSSYEGRTLIVLTTTELFQVVFGCFWFILNY